MVVGVGFGAIGASIAGADFQTPAGSANIGLPNIPVPVKKKKKEPIPVPVTPLPEIVPVPAIQQGVDTFRDRLAEIVQTFATATSAIATPRTAAPTILPPADQVTIQPIAPTFGLASTAPSVPAVPKKLPAQGVTPAAAASRQRRTAASAAKPRTILTSGRGLLDLEADESRRARKTLLGA